MARGTGSVASRLLPGSVYEREVSMEEYFKKSDVVDFIKSYRHSTDVAFHMEEHLYEIPSADVISKSEYENCRNELCYKCGEYKNRHLGACDGCRWLDG